MWKLRDIVLAAILAVVCGVIFYGIDLATAPLYAASSISPIIGAIPNGFWMLAGTLVPYIVRRPGAALLSEVAASFVEFAFGGPYGVAGTILSGIVQGAGSEVGFMAGRWRRYGTGSMLLAGALGGFGYLFQWWFEYGGNRYATGQAVGYVLVTLCSGALFAGILPKLIGDALLRTGVLRNFAIGRQG